MCILSHLNRSQARSQLITSGNKRLWALLPDLRHLLSIHRALYCIIQQPLTNPYLIHSTMSDAVDPAVAYLHAVTDELLAQQEDGPSLSSVTQPSVPNIQASVMHIHAAEASAVMKVGEVLDT